MTLNRGPTRGPRALSPALLVLCCLAAPAVGRRAQDLAASNETHFLAAAGAAEVAGRFVLLQRLPGPPARGEGGLLEVAAAEAWPETLAALSVRFMGKESKLGGGSFGEAWEALDKLHGRKVALKLFPDGKHGYLRWGGDMGQKKRAVLEEASEECDILQHLHSRAAADPTGASRILDCYENHIKPWKSEDSKTTLSYLVLELGGRTLPAFMYRQRHGAHSSPEVPRGIVVEFLQALRLMQAMEPAIIHHDIKPANAVYTKGSDGAIHVKLIDFGAYRRGTEASQRQSGVYTPVYAPPEQQGAYDFEEPWWSYDVFAVGMIYIQLLCPQLRVSDLHDVLVKYKLTLRSTLETFMAGKDPRGEVVHKACPEVSKEEMDLIVSMVGPARHRPSPSDALSNAVLRQLALNLEVPQGPAQSAEKGAFTDLSPLFRGENTIQAGGRKLKCCCWSLDDCLLSDVDAPEHSCGFFGKFGTPSCSCLVRAGWRSYRQLSSASCIVKTDSRFVGLLRENSLL